MSGELLKLVKHRLVGNLGWKGATAEQVKNTMSSWPPQRPSSNIGCHRPRPRCPSEKWVENCWNWWNTDWLEILVEMLPQRNRLKIRCHRGRPSSKIGAPLRLKYVFRPFKFAYWDLNSPYFVLSFLYVHKYTPKKISCRLTLRIHHTLMICNVFGSCASKDVLWQILTMIWSLGRNYRTRKDKSLKPPP